METYAGITSTAPLTGERDIAVVHGYGQDPDCEEAGAAILGPTERVESPLSRIRATSRAHGTIVREGHVGGDSRWTGDVRNHQCATDKPRPFLGEQGARDV